jgi:hypothetical protein
MRQRWIVVLLLGLGPVAAAARAEAPPSDGGSGFRLEGRSAIDDVFGDTADYRRTVDRFLELTTQMQALRDDFARATQQVLAEIASRSDGKSSRRSCPVDAVAAPYGRAQHLGAEYLRIGRELARHHEQVREYDRLGESIGLTPDYRWKVRRVLAQYAALLTDYREMKVAFHDQLNDELRYLGCDLPTLLWKGDPQARTPLAPVAADDAWPQPGAPGAPGVALARVDPPAHGEPQAPPATLPAERVPVPLPIALPQRTPPANPAPRTGVLFYVDNSRCARGTVLFLDGKRLGDVPGAARVGFQTAAGPHDMCLIDDARKQCGAPGTVRRSYLHEGWTISLRCD